MSLYWEESGPRNAPTILFLHGMGVSSWMWTEQVAHLQRDFHIITVDLPANGKSHTVPWRSLEASADLVAAIIEEHATGGKAHVVGLSLGGYTALALAIRHPQLLESVLVSGLSTAPLANRWLMKRIAMNSFGIMRWQPLAKLQARALKLPPEAEPHFLADLANLTPQNVARVYDEILGYALPAELATTPVRILAVAGDKEVAAVTRGLARFEAIPTATTRLIPGGHHAWNGEYPALFSDMVRAWVENKPLPIGLIDPTARRKASA